MRSFVTALVRVGSRQEGAVAAVSTGMRQLESADHGEILAVLFQWLQDRRDLVIGACRGRRKLTSIEPQPPHAENGSPRNLSGSQVTCGLGTDGLRTHRFEPGKCHCDTGTAEQTATVKAP